MAGIEAWVGRAVVDGAGPYGRLEEVFVGRRSGLPEFGIVGLADRRVAVPLHGASAGADGIALGVRRDQVEEAPAVRGEVDEIPLEAGDRILAHFGVDPEGSPPPAVDAPTPPPSAAAGEDVEITLSEERLQVRTRRVPTERVRMRKRIVTDEVTLTVTVQREELVVEREPLAADGAVGDVPEAVGTGEGAEFVLYAEEPVVERRIVPVERVRVSRGEVTETRQVFDQVRRERFEVEEFPTEEETQ